MVARVCRSTGAGENTARWDAEVEEADIVRPGPEGSSHSQFQILVKSNNGVAQNSPKVCVLALSCEILQ